VLNAYLSAIGKQLAKLCH